MPQRWALTKLSLRCADHVLSLLYHLPACSFTAEEAEAVHRVAWSRHGGGSGAWLASAGAAGVVRCQWIQTN